MAKREAFAFVAGPLVVAGTILLPPWVFQLAVAVAVVVAADEMVRMSAAAGAVSSRWAVLLLTAGTMAASWRWGPPGFTVAAAVTVLALPVVRLGSRRGPDGSLAAVSVGSFTVLFLGLGGSCLGWLRALPADPDGWQLVLLFLVAIWLGDSGAYYVGRALGRHRMSPRTSPNKTWEGLAGGVVATFAGAAAFRLGLGLLGGMDLGWGHAMAIAAILAVAAPVGDLVESQVKRDTGVKDSSGLIPGHGGFLDRTDSLLFAAPPVLAYLLVTGVVS